MDLVLALFGSAENLRSLARAEPENACWALPDARDLERMALLVTLGDPVELVAQLRRLDTSCRDKVFSCGSETQWAEAGVCFG